MKMHPIKYKTKLSVVTKKQKRIFNVASVLSPPILHIILISKENSDQTSLSLSRKHGHHASQLREEYCDCYAIFQMKVFFGRALL